jgi:hypothetical protein
MVPEIKSLLGNRIVLRAAAVERVAKLQGCGLFLEKADFGFLFQE